jgi:hypothetical protein
MIKQPDKNELERWRKAIGGGTKNIKTQTDGRDL